MPDECKDKNKVFFYKNLTTCSHVLLLTKFEVKVPAYEETGELIRLEKAFG